MSKLEQLEDDVLRALATWHGVGVDELGLQWKRLAENFAMAVDFSGVTNHGSDGDDVGAVAVRASLLVDALGAMLDALSHHVE